MKKNRGVYPIISLMFLLAVAISENSYALDARARHENHASAENSVACPSQDFPKFLKAFSESKKIQIAFTKYPLRKQQLDLNADPEPKPFIRNLERHQIEFPVFPGEAKRKKESLNLRIDKLTSGKAELTIRASDSDSYQVSYFFSKNSCWKLERIEDWSL